MYELHQNGIAFVEFDLKHFGRNEQTFYVAFGYGFYNTNDNIKELIDEDYKNFSKLVEQFYDEFKGKNITIEQVITIEVILDNKFISDIDSYKLIAKRRFKQLHFIFRRGIPLKIQDIYHFLPSYYFTMPKSTVVMMIKIFQVMYGGTPEEAFKESEKESQLINQKTEELMNLPYQNPDPDKHFDLFY